MNPRVKAVKPNPDNTITLLFTNGEARCFDVRPYLGKGIFRELNDLRNFNSVKPFLGSIRRQNGQDFCPDTLYLDSVPAGRQTPSRGTAVRPGRGRSVKRKPCDTRRAPSGIVVAMQGGGRYGSAENPV